MYNWVLDREAQQYQEHLKNPSVASFLNDGTLRKELTVLKRQKGYEWLQNIDCLAYKKFFRGESNYPQRKTRKRTIPSFYQDTKKIKIKDNKVKLTAIVNSRKKNRQKLNWVRIVTKNYIPEEVNYYNPKVKYDGINWWLTVSVKFKDSNKNPTNEGIKR